MEARRTVLIAGSLEGVRQAAKEFDAFSVANQLPTTATWPFHVALDEVLSNIVRYGYGEQGHGREIEIQFQLGDGVLEVSINDDAVAFNPLEAEEPDTTLPLDQRSVGGLGVFMVKNLMDSVAYERAGERNHLVLRRRVDA